MTFFVRCSLLAALCVAAAPTFSEGVPQRSFEIYPLLDRVFGWQEPRVSGRQDGIGWQQGAYYTGVAALYRETGDIRFRDAILAVGEEANWRLRRRSGGKGLYHADDHCMGQAWLELYLQEETPEAVWINDVKTRINLVMADPKPGRVDYDWVDALYMAPPVYVRLWEVTNETRFLSFIDGQWADAVEFLFDEEWGLFYRDSRYFDDKEPNGNPVFWSRGNGWAMAGTVRMLQHIPDAWPNRGQYEALLLTMADRLRQLRDPLDGMWRSSLAYPEKFDGGPEASATAFFTYAMAWGINHGLLEKNVYDPVIEKAWAGLQTLVEPDGSILRIQQIGGEPEMWDGGKSGREYGYGAFILAGLEMLRYYENQLSADLPETWAGFEVGAGGDVNTQGLMGWLNILDRPWVWSYAFGHYLYLEESWLDAQGTWAWLPKD